MKNTIPHTPFSTPLSGSAKETELRLKNIFSGPKKRPPALFLALMFSACLLCGNLVSCQMAEAEENPPALSQHEPPAAPKLELPSLSELKPDLNQNGVPEELRLVEKEDGDLLLEVRENGELLFREPGQFDFPGAEFVYTKDGVDYLLRYKNWGTQDDYYYSYSIADFSGEFEEPVQWSNVEFDLNFGAPYHKDFDPEAIAALVEEVNSMLPDCQLLFCTSPELMDTFEEKGRLEDDLSWLDRFPDVFTRDPDKSLLENLQNFKTAMTAAHPTPVPQPVDSLPITEPLEMIFLSGAGAWCTGLTLNPDGTFTGDYHDADGYVLYVCPFHGKFGSFEQLTDHSWSLTLEELVLELETGRPRRPVGVEWEEDDLLKVSSVPNGFLDADGNILSPGAKFILYSPEAKGDKPGTELYGATALLDWCLSRPDLAGGEPLGCWDLYNLAQEIGFFSD